MDYLDVTFQAIFSWFESTELNFNRIEKVSVKPDETEKGVGFWSFVKVHETLIWITFAIYAN